VGRDANLPCVVEHLGGYKVRNGENGEIPGRESPEEVGKTGGKLS